MKTIYLKKQLVPALHLLFWFLSLNFWNMIFNPDVESTFTLRGFGTEWALFLLFFLCLLYSSLPFIWLVKKARLWIKISISLLFLIPLFYVIVQSVIQNGNKEDVEEFIYVFVKSFLYVLIFNISIFIAVYLNLNFLVTRFLKRSMFAQYLLYASILCVIAALLNYSFFNFFIDQLFPELFYISYFRIGELILIVASYLCFTTVVFLIWQYGMMLIANRDAARNELSALKAQINPHFLFNNLNTIYSMASKNDLRTADVVLKLSDFLRYVLYDTASDTIPLEKEVEIIRTYVSLQKERVHPEITRIELTTEGKFKGVEIAPLLLLPLAENCFKHGKGKNEGVIQIFIGFDGKQLIFRTENNIALREKTIAKENGGIGINNVENRLQLIYPQHHSLEYGAKNGVFTLEMKIELN